MDEGCGAVCGNGICEAGEADVCVDCFSTQTDVDSDGYSPPEDCDDFNFFTHPGADEFCDGKDNDCDGLTDEGYPTQRFLRDADGDGHGDPESYVEAADCLSPLEGYINWIEGYDNDCDDNFALTYPGAEEICDGDDNNCDGQIDEGCCGNGICNSTEDVFTCQVDCPAEEECDGVDNDNDHAIDDGCPCVDPSETIWDRHCGHAMPAGEFFYGWQTCENGIWTECRYGDSIGEQSCEWHCQNDGDGDGLVCCFDPDCADLPQCQEPLDLCNGVDEDGDGETDENDPSVGSLCVAINTIPDEEGIVSYVPVNGRWECSHDVMNYRCSPDPALCYAEDYCDNWIDDDCDGIVDEGCGADEPPHYCEPVYTAYGTIIGWRGCCGDSFLTTTHPEAGMLIKGTFSNVYYYASDGNRYVFATNVELESWYSPLDEYGIPASPNGELCQQVYEFPDEVLASIPLALTGNVTLRPGAFITGEETSSARYVVDHCATLREVDPITALDEIYASTEGSTAWERTVVLWSLMWSNYEIGQPVTSAADFDWLTIYSESQIEVELGISGTLCQ
ncbi:MAG: putative metal-binding motif-containing protein [Patescibacteria group bacterium]